MHDFLNHLLYYIFCLELGWFAAWNIRSRMARQTEQEALKLAQEVNKYLALEPSTIRPRFSRPVTGFYRPMSEK